MNQFTDLEQIDYGSIIRLHRGQGYQLFAIERNITGAPVYDSTDTHLDVFLNRTVGVTDRLMARLSQSPLCLDDLRQPLEIRTSDFERRALACAYIATGVSQGISPPPVEDPTNKWTAWQDLPQSLYTHCYVMKGHVQHHRILILLKTDASLLVLSCICDLTKWSPSDKASPSLYRNFLRLDEFFDLAHLESVDWSDSSRSIMVMAFKDHSDTFTVFFPCDTNRMRWRRALRPLIPRDWTSNVLPDLHLRDRHTRKLL